MPSELRFYYKWGWRVEVVLYNVWRKYVLVDRSEER